MQLTVKALLNSVQDFPGFVFEDIRLARDGQGGAVRLEATLQAHRGRPPRCSRCRQPAPGYDQLPRRAWLFIPAWGVPARFLYAPRRVRCPAHGVVVEHMPWSEGKRTVSRPMMCFLARWARRLSWRETARAFQTSWESVYRSVEWFVRWGLAHRRLKGVESIGVDEIHWAKGQRANSFLTVIYQIDQASRRLLWVGRRRTRATLRRGLAALGEEVVGGLRHVCSDMWKPYLKEIAARAGHALHVLDRFHITAHLNRALDQVRRAEGGRLRRAASDQAARLKDMRWKLLRRGARLRGHARQQVHALVRSKLATARAWILKETFEPFWRYKSSTWAGGFLDCWTARALRSRLPPMRRVAGMLRSHRPLLMNWFAAKGEISSGAVEGLNNKIRVVTRRSYGFRTYAAMEIALYHTLGKLPEPDELTHKFC